MEIVKQRKKRLIAWILTLVLCVGLWQVDAQATEEGNEEEITPVEEQTNTEVSLIDINKGSINGSNNDTFKVGEKEGTFASSGSYTFTNPFTVGAGQYSSGSYKHNVLEWRDDASENTITSETTFDTESKVYAVLGKCIVVEWTGTGSGDAVETYSQDSDSEGISIDIRDIDDGYKIRDNKFLVGWKNGDDTYSIGRQYPTSYKEFQKIIKFEAQYSNTVTEDGTYYLPTGITFFTASGTNWSIGDGYTYQGGISFSVSERKDYSFSKIR